MADRFDPETTLDRIRNARSDQAPAAQPEPEAESTEQPTDVRDLGARMFGRRYEGDPLAKIADRMFRH